MKKVINFLAIAVMAIVAVSCCDDDSFNPGQTSEYASGEMWCYCPKDCKADVDVFYVVSTMIMYDWNPDGTESFNASLTKEQKDTLASEIFHVRDNIIPGSVNFFAPYYHEMTMHSVEVLDSAQIRPRFQKGINEVCEAFDYYMEHYNNGRPFILVGYSQGAVMVKHIMKRMSDEQYKRMIASYIIGYGISDDDLKDPHIKAAQDSVDTGVAISWNSVNSPDSVFEKIVKNAKTCINPVSWKADDPTPCTYHYENEELTLHIDNDKHVLVVDGLHADQHNLPTYTVDPFPKGCYHSYELYLYNHYLWQNMKDRITAFKNLNTVFHSK